MTKAPENLLIVHADGVAEFAGRRVRCALGRGGIRADKSEGDGATPTGRYPMRRVLFRADRLAPPVTGLAAAPIAPGDGWCDDPEDANYNQPVTLPHSARHEEMWRDDGLYDVVVVLGRNDDPPVPNRGSAVFLHVASPDYGPTEGCVALALADLLEFLAAGGAEPAIEIRATRSA